MLHWLYIFLYLSLCIFCSILIYNKSLLQILLLSEILIIFLFFSLLVISATYNIYYMVGISFFLIIFGGLELSLSILLITL